MMKKINLVMTLLLVFILVGCKDKGPVNNFEERRDSVLISEDKTVVIEYKTDSEGKMIELNIDRLLTIEQMILFNPLIDYDYEIEGFTGDIFMEPDYSCTDLDNNYLVPINIEVGNTRYKYSDDECMYKTVNNYNEIVPGYSEEYLLTDTIPESKSKKITIVVYMPDEVVNFFEIYELPNTYEHIGIYNIMFNLDDDGFRFNLINYYRDMGMFEQLYLKHQEAEGSMSEVLGITTDINLLDLNSISEITPLINDFEEIYEAEILAILELQAEIGVGFETDTESVEDE